MGLVPGTAAALPSSEGFSASTGSSADDDAAPVAKETWPEHSVCVASIGVRPVVSSDLERLTSLFVTCFNAPPWDDGWSHAGAQERLGAIIGAARCRSRAHRRGGRAP
jgi:hypothetical protein